MGLSAFLRQDGYDLASTRMKFTQKMHQSITFQATSSTCTGLPTWKVKKS